MSLKDKQIKVLANVNDPEQGETSASTSERLNNSRGRNNQDNMNIPQTVNTFNNKNEEEPINASRQNDLTAISGVSDNTSLFIEQSRDMNNSQNDEDQVRVCDECEDENATIACGRCGQKLCKSCDMRIHNKGKRALHKREPIQSKQKAAAQQGESFGQNQNMQGSQVNQQKQIGQNINQVNEMTPSQKSSQQQQIKQQQYFNPALNLPMANQQQISGNIGGGQYINNQQNIIIQQQQLNFQPSTPGGINANYSNQTIGQGTPSSQLIQSGMNLQNQNMQKIGEGQTFTEQNAMLMSGGNKMNENLNQQQQQMLMMMMQAQYQNQMLSPRLQEQQQFFSQQQQQQPQYKQQLQQDQQQQFQQQKQFFSQTGGKQGVQQFPQQMAQMNTNNILPPNINQNQQQFIDINGQNNKQQQQQQQQQQYYMPNILNQTNISASFDNSYDQNLSYNNIYNSFNQYKINPEINGDTPTMNNDENLQTPNLTPQQNAVNRNFSEIISSARQNKTFNVSIDHGFSFGDGQDDTSFMSQKNNANNIPVNPIEISVYQDFSHFDSKDISQEICKKILIGHAKQGDLLVKIETFKDEYQKEVGKGQFVNIDKIIKNLEQKQVIHSTIRKFGDSNPIQYISIHLNQISIEVIIWIILSIRNDEMTPNEKMVLSRIKECYGVKINQLYWNGVILYIKSLADINGDVIFNKPNIVNLKLKKIKEPLNNQESYLMYIKDNVEWIHNDNGRILHEDKDLWKIFIEFIKEFFSENDGDALNTSISACNMKQKHKWTSSVENVHTKSTKKTIVRPPKSINKAIPGGRYGCAQLLKCCGPLPLRSCSLGKLSLFVQEAITRGILVYYKTLLIKPTNFDFDEVMDITVLEQTNESEINNTNFVPINADDTTNRTDSQKSLKNNQVNPNPHVLQPSVSEEKLSKEQLEKIQFIKTTILEILQENKRGVSLARLPKLIQKKIEFTFDLHELGFPKLKSLLQTITDVIIENDGTTQAQAVLKQNLSGNIQTVNTQGMQSSGSNDSINNNPQQFQQNKINKQIPFANYKGTSQNAAPKFFGNSPAINVQDQEDEQDQVNEYQSGSQPLIQGSPTSQNSNQNNVKNTPMFSTNSNQRDLSPHSYNKKFCTLKPDNYGKKVQNHTNGRTYSNLEDYRSKIISTIQSILNDNQYGLMSYKLNELLNQKLNARFEFSLFGCTNFNEFLSKYTESFADILVKQNNYIVYSKNSQFNPLTMRAIHPKLIQQSSSQQGSQNNQQQQSAQQNQQQQQGYPFPYNQSQQQQGQQPGDKNSLLAKQMQSPLTKYDSTSQQFQQMQKQLISTSCNSSFLSSPPQFKNDSFFHNNSQISQSFTNFSINMTGNQPSEINNQIHEESHNELDENLKFIEELLNDEEILQLGHQRKHSQNSTGTFRAFQGYDNNIFYNQHKSPQNTYQNQRKYSPLYSNDIPEIIHEEPNMQGYKYGQQGHAPSQFGHQPPGSKSMNIELQGISNNMVYQNTNHVDKKNQQKFRHKTLNYQN